ncbi:MAG: arginase family protein [Actinomycetota bacterium]|nr:arginase family protein [Actinomycetota bacterium]
MTRRTMGLIGVPSSAGAHWPGQDKAPRALREVGMVGRLEAVGLGVVDYGDLPRARFRPDSKHRQSQNLEAVVEVTRLVADKVEQALLADEIPLVIGGDCTIELGVLSGFMCAGQDPALLYLDGGVDLRTPTTNPTGILDSMGVAHMVGEPGAAEELARIGPRFPLMEEERIVLFGYEPNPPEIEVLERRSMPRYPAKIVRNRPREAAAEALAQVEEEAERFVVHFDVDVIDFVDFPIADVPQHNAGLTFREAIACLEVFASSPYFAGLTITEFNPDHADEEGELAATFVREVADTLAGNQS